MECWARWAAFIRTNGLTNVYDTDTDYLPAYHYLLYMYAYSKESADAIFTNLKYFKMIIFLFHLGSSYFLMRIVQMISGDYRIKYGVFYLLNIAVLYNTLVWGQVDEIISFFMIGCLYFFLKANPRWAILTFILGVNFKLQSVIFLPIVLFLAIPLYACQKWKKRIIDLSLFISAQVFILLPFILSGKLHKVFNVLFNLVDSQPFISANAYNLWFGIVGREARYRFDSDIFLIFTYKQWGLTLFFILSFFALLPLFIASFKSIWQRTKPSFNSNLVILSFGIIPLIFFFFCTQMHERYSHPAIVFIVLYSIISKKWYLGFIASLAYFLNLDYLLKSLSFQNYGVLIFNYRFIAGLYLFVIILLFKDIYKLAIEERLFKRL
jgi:Gpi18-like mannosyltransferase